MKKDLPKHVSEALQKKRDEFILELNKQGFNLIEISTLFGLTSQRVWQIILKGRTN